MKRSIIGSTFWLVALSSGCSAGDKPAPLPNDPVASSAASLPLGSPSTDTPEVAPVDAPENNASKQTKAGDAVVELLDPGALSRNPLRYRFTNGHKLTIVQQSDLAYHIEWNKQPVSDKETFVTKSIIDLAFGETDKNGVAEVFFTLRSHTTTTNKREKKARVFDLWGRSQQHAAELQGTKGTLFLDGLGRGVLGNVELPKRKPGQVDPWQERTLHQILSTVFLLLPVEPIAEGAQWQITMPVKLPEFEYTLKSLVRLVEIKDSTLKLEVNALGHAFSQEIDLLPKHKKEFDRMFLDSVYISNKETRSLDLARLLPDSQSADEVKYGLSVDRRQETFGVVIKGTGTTVTFVLEGAK